MTRARMNHWTGNWVCQPSMTAIPKANMVTRRGIKIKHQKSGIREKGVAPTEDGSIPPLGDLRVTRHETSVDIRLFAHCTARLSPDLLAEVKSCMGQGSSDRCKGKTVGDSESSGNIERAVSHVLLFVERGVVVENP